MIGNRNKKANMKKILNSWQLYLMFLPVAVLLLIFNYFPMYGVTLAFKDFNPRLGIFGSKWIGFEHFQTLFTDPYFLKVLWNTIRISLLKFAIGFPVPIILTLMLNEVKNAKFKRTVQTVSYLPYFISWVVVSGILINIFSIDGGQVNKLIQTLGGEQVNFFGDSNAFLTLLVISDIWKNAGWGTVIYFAAIANINPELYEAAMIDGANRFQRMRHITLPGMVPALSINLIFSCSSLLSAGFDQIFNLYNPVVYKVADIIDTYIFRIGISDGNYGISTALGLFNSVISVTLILVVNKVIKKLGGEGIW